MRKIRESTRMLFVGICGLAIGACSQSNSGNSNTGGTTDTGGMVSSSGGSATGGSEAATGGNEAATGGMKATGGAATGGATGGNPEGGKTTGTGGDAPAKTGGTTSATGGKTSATGGAAETGGKAATGGSATGGKAATGGSATGGAATGGTPVATGGRTTTGGGTCTASKPGNLSVSGSGKYKVVVETNSDSAMACGTIYRPQDLGGAEKFPIFAWGEGACSRDGKSNSASMAEIASHGYFVIADGPLNGGNCPGIGMPNTAADLPNMGKPLLGYIKWAIAENDKPCSAYFDSLDSTKVAADGFSCGGLMASGTSADPIMTTYGITSSGLTGPDQNFYSKIHTPFKALTGSTDMAYDNAKRDYQQISALGIPSVFFSKNGAGHGGDLGAKNGGDFTKVNLAWLNWQLKGDTTATGKGFLIGADCTFCNNGGWEVMSKNIQ
jgi:hypothetical protein